LAGIISTAHLRQLIDYQHCIVDVRLFSGCIFFAQYCAMDATLLALMSKEDLIAELLRRDAAIDTVKAEVAASESREMGLLRRLAELSRMQFGSKSERFVPGDPSQLLLDFGQAMEVARQEAAAETQTVTYERKKKSRKETPVRERLPEDLPRKIVIIEPDFDTTGMIQVGFEVTEELECQPGHVYVVEYRRPKYIRATSDEATEIACAQLPSRPIWKGIAGPGLLAWIITEKFLWHIPFHRQWQRFASQGIRISTSTMGGWFARSCDQLRPIYQELKRIALESRYLQGDETPIKVQDKDKKGATHRGWHWVYHAPDEKIVVFDYQKTRSKAGPTRCKKTGPGYTRFSGWIPCSPAATMPHATRPSSTPCSERQNSMASTPTIGCTTPSPSSTATPRTGSTNSCRSNKPNKTHATIMHQNYQGSRVSEICGSRDGYGLAGGYVWTDGSCR
jgi:transposase